MRLARRLVTPNWACLGEFFTHCVMMLQWKQKARMAKPICVHLGARHWAHGPCPQTTIYIISYGVVQDVRNPGKVTPTCWTLWSPFHSERQPFCCNVEVHKHGSNGISIRSCVKLWWALNQTRMNGLPATGRSVIRYYTTKLWRKRILGLYQDSCMDRDMTRTYMEYVCQVYMPQNI